MKVIIEEIDNQVAHILTVDDIQSFYMEENQLPKGVKIGAIYDVVRSSSGELKWEYLAEETQSQLDRVKKKRDQLKKRK